LRKNGTKADIIMVTAEGTEAARLVLRKLYTEVVPVDYITTPEFKINTKEIQDYDKDCVNKGANGRP